MPHLLDLKRPRLLSVFGVLLGLALGPASAEDRNPDKEIHFVPLDLEAVTLHSALLPAWGALESESFFLGTFQFLVDLLAVAALVSPPGNPDAGSGVVTLIGAGAFIGNRLAGVPVNVFWASRYNGRAAETGGPSAPLPLGMALLGGTGGYRSDKALSLGLSLETTKYGFKLSYSPGTADISVVTRGPDADNRMRNLDRREVDILSFTAYRRYLLGKNLEFQPGLNWTRCDYQYATTEYDRGTGAMPTSAYVQFGGQNSVVPEATLAWRPWPRIHGSAGLGFALLMPKHHLDFDDGKPEWLKRLGLHAELGWKMF